MSGPAAGSSVLISIAESPEQPKVASGSTSAMPVSPKLTARGSMLSRSNTSEPVKIVDTTAGWATVLKAMKEYDARMVESWKQEMDNLLIFAGLFSAVVTAFSVESYKLLTPTTPSGKMLSTISRQISSFTVKDGILNSTHILAKRATPTPVSSLIVKVNTLWFLSLTLSVIAAFFAIAVQQWLRHIPIPAHIPLREAVRLRQLRYSGLMRWQVPTIISMLPALLQISVVLFLVGLLQFIRHYNREVALPFTVISSISLVLFAIVSLVPLVQPSCPYKSPLVHITWELTWLAGAVSSYVIMIPVVTLFDCFATAKRQTLFRIANSISSWTNGILTALKPPTTETSRVWTSREVKVASKEKNISDLDLQALSWALTAGPNIADIECCLEDLTVEDRPHCVLQWISVKLEGHTDIYRLLKDGTLRPEIYNKVDHIFSENYRDLLFSVLSKDWPETEEDEKDSDKPFDRMAEPNIPTILMFISKITKVDRGQPWHKSYEEAFMRELQEICYVQRIDADHERTWKGWNVPCRVPTVLLFDCCIKSPQSHHPPLPPALSLFTGDVKRVMDWARHIAVVVMGVQRPDDPDTLWITPQEIILSSSAIALATLADARCADARQSEEIISILRELLTQLRDLTRMARETIGVISTQADIPRRLKDSKSLLFVTPDALLSICHSLEILADSQNGCLPIDDQCPSEKLAEHLLEICRGHATLSHGISPLQQFEVGVRNSMLSEKPRNSRMNTIDDAIYEKEQDSSSNEIGIPELTHTGEPSSDER